MKVYGTLKTKDPIAYILFADDDSILYHDSECTDAVTAAEIELLFFKGVFVTISGALTAATAYAPADDSTAYATLTIGAGTYYTGEYEAD